MRAKFIVLLLLGNTIVYGEELSTEEILQGFDDEAPIVQNEQTSNYSNWQFISHFAYTSAYNFAQQSPSIGNIDRRGIAKSQFNAEFELKWKGQKAWDLYIGAYGFYDFSFSEYPVHVREEYERQLEFKELFVRVNPLQQLDVKLGRQVVVWGRSETFRVLDVISPLNNREPGMTDIKNLRLPLWMVRSDYYFKPWHLQFLVIPHIEFDRNPIFESDYYPFPAPPPANDEPEDLKHLELAIGLSGQFRAWDVSFHGSSHYDDNGYYTTSPAGTINRHERLTMLGLSAARVWGNFLLKFELARFTKLRYSNIQGKEFSRLDVLAGLEFVGLSDTQVVVEVLKRHLHDYHAALKNPPDLVSVNEFATTIRVVRSLLHDRLDLLSLWVGFGEEFEQGGLFRNSAEYEINQAWRIAFGWVDYLAGDSPVFSALQDNDRLFLEIRYSNSF